jgi:hypothetical protein
VKVSPTFATGSEEVLVKTATLVSFTVALLFEEFWRVVLEQADKPVMINAVINNSVELFMLIHP